MSCKTAGFFSHNITSNQNVYYFLFYLIKLYMSTDIDELTRYILELYIVKLYIKVVGLWKKKILLKD